MKKALTIALFVVILVLGWVLYRQFASTIEFNKERATREAVIVQRLKDIRTAQRAFKQQYQKYTPSFDTLVNFILHDSLVYTKAIGSMDDSLAVARGLVSSVEFKVPAKDTLFSGRGLSEADIRQFSIIPFSRDEKFIMDTASIVTESSYEVPVFEARAPYKSYMYDLNQQELVNLIDEQQTLKRYPGLKVGSLTEATNEAGNWE